MKRIILLLLFFLNISVFISKSGVGIGVGNKLSAQLTYHHWQEYQCWPNGGGIVGYAGYCFGYWGRDGKDWTSDQWDNFTDWVNGININIDIDITSIDETIGDESTDIEPDEFGGLFGDGGDGDPQNPCTTTLDNLSHSDAITFIQGYMNGNNDPFQFFTINESTKQKWSELVEYIPSITVLDKTLIKSHTADVSDADFNRVNDMNNVNSQITNLDYFPVKVTSLPTVDGVQLTAKQTLNYIYNNFNNFLDHSIVAMSNERSTSFFQNALAVNPNDPFITKTALFKLDRGTGNVGYCYANYPNSVKVNDNFVPSTSFTLTTLKDPYNVITSQSTTSPRFYNGNREFGYVSNSDGSYTFYTKGISRSTIDGNPLQYAADGKQVENETDVWSSFQESVNDFVNLNAGQASMQEIIIMQPDYTAIQNVINGNLGLCHFADANVPDDDIGSNNCQGTELVTTPHQIEQSQTNLQQLLALQSMQYGDGQSNNPLITSGVLSQANFNALDPNLRTTMQVAFILGTSLNSTLVPSATSMYNMFTDWTRVNEPIGTVDYYRGNNIPGNSNQGDVVLANVVTGNSHFISYANKVEAYFRSQMKQHQGNVNSIPVNPHVITPPVFGSGKGLNYPSTWPDYFNLVNGLTILIDNVTSANAFVKSVKFCPDNKHYTAIIEYTLDDDFGLDDNDVINHNYNSFQAWYILQHYRAYKPFVTEIVTDREVDGTIN